MDLLKTRNKQKAIRDKYRCYVRRRAQGEQIKNTAR